MRVVVIGATGTIGEPVAAELGKRHEVVPVANRTGPWRVDISSAESIEKLYASIGPFDALVSAAGLAKFGPLESLTEDDFLFSLRNKLMGQVNLVRLGLRHVRGRGSFTLTSGVLASEPMAGSAAVSMVNAGVEAFARAAALELEREVRINVVSPPWISETLAGMSRDPAGGMPARKVAAAYVHAVEGRGNGEVIDARKFA